jgi:hypothetical protein
MKTPSLLSRPIVELFLVRLKRAVLAMLGEISALPRLQIAPVFSEGTDVGQTTGAKVGVHTVVFVAAATAKRVLIE